MDGCQLWLPPAQAGSCALLQRLPAPTGSGAPRAASWRRGHTGSRSRTSKTGPLTNAAVYVYHVSQAPVQDSGAKYFADRPKFIGQTDAEGRFIFPDHTDEDWDDAATDEVDGAVQVWNPFGGAKTDTAFTPNVWTVEGLLLIKIVSGGETEFRWMDQLEFKRPVPAGQHSPRGLSRSHLPPLLVRSNAHRAAASAGGHSQDESPTSGGRGPPEWTVKRGESFEIDGSASTDPEGQPLEYRWGEQGRWLAGDLHQGPVPRLQAPNEPGKRTYTFYVLDGLRCSDKAEIEVTFE